MSLLLAPAVLGNAQGRARKDAAAYPPPHPIYNNPYWGIDCESIDQIRQVIGRFGLVA